MGSIIIIEGNYPHQGEFLFSISSSTSKKQQEEVASYQVIIYLCPRLNLSKCHFARKATNWLGLQTILQGRKGQI